MWFSDRRARLTCDRCYEHPWLKQDTGKMEAKKLSKERMKKYILRRKWQVGNSRTRSCTVSQMAPYEPRSKVVHYRIGCHLGRRLKELDVILTESILEQQDAFQTDNHELYK